MIQEAVYYRFLPKIRQGKKIVILYLGDFDPSGLNMDETTLEHIKTFAGSLYPFISFERIALTWDQIELYNPPPNPVKKKNDGSYSDTRGEKYVALYGPSSWELDALRPEILDRLITDSIKVYLRPKTF